LDGGIHKPAVLLQVPQGLKPVVIMAILTQRLSVAPSSVKSYVR
jgi:hypothetical protein